MTETPISQDDINALADALDGLNLPPAQRVLLSTIVALAAKTVPADVVDPASSFREQFDSAFTPSQAISDTSSSPPAGVTRITSHPLG